MKRSLIFVYNATSDFWSKYIDVAHKIVSPSTYPCDLCSLTHGNFSEKKIWKEFRETTEDEFVFMYKNEFENQYPDYVDVDLPIVMKKTEKGLDELITAAQFSEIHSVEELMKFLQRGEGN